MSFLSSAWKKTKKAVSTGWDSTKDAVKDATGVTSMNALVMGGPLAVGAASLGGHGFMGEGLNSILAPLTAVPEPPAPPGGAMSGGLHQSAPAGLTMGAGGGVPGAGVQGRELASLFGDSGYQYGAGPSQLSAQLLASNPEAYQYAPLFPHMVG